MDRSKKKAIRNLLSVVGSAIFIGFLFSTLLLYKYNPSGQYIIQNVLVSPEILAGLNFNAANKKTGGTSRYIFDKIQFENGKNVGAISPPTYTVFFNQVKNAKSLSIVTDEVKNAFNRGQPIKLKILIKTDSPAEWQANTQIFQEIDFSSQGDYFRVQLRESHTGSDNFAYFQARGIYAIIQSLVSGA
jgi:hypothetical protein